MRIDLDSAVETVVSLARAAAAEILRVEAEGIRSDRKADRSIVTNADHAADKVIREGLRAAFPGVPVLTEESGLEGPVDDLFWAVDPLDGTRAFARGDSGFAVMIGLVERTDGAARPVLGVVLDPRHDDLYVGIDAAGRREAWRLPRGGPRRPIAVSPRPDPPRLVVTTSMPDAEALRIAGALGAEPPRKIHSVGVKVGLLVAGEADVYVNTHPVSTWDLAAPAAILAAAGGTYSDLEGRPLALAPRLEKAAGGTLAVIGRDHAATLAAVRSVLGPVGARP